MLERWTVDAIAGEIEGQIEVAALSPKLLRRFYKQGKKHGRRSTMPEPTQTLIINAVDIATSKIAEDFVAEAQQLRKGIARADAQLADALEAPRDPVEPPNGDVAPAIQAPVGGPDMSLALASVRQRRIDAESAGRRTQYEQDKAARRDAQAERSVAVQSLRDLPSKFRQSVESCHETGELLWSRYRGGYADGASRRGPSEVGVAPEQSIAFDIPPVFDDLVRLSRINHEDGT